MDHKQLTSIMVTAVNIGYNPVFYKMSVEYPTMSVDLQLAEVHFIERWIREEKKYSIKIGVYGDKYLGYRIKKINFGKEWVCSSDVMFDTYDDAWLHGIELMLVKIGTDGR